MIDETTLFKATGPRGRSCHGGDYTWRCGVWTREIKPVLPCSSGYHLCRGPQILGWLNKRLYVAEIHPDADVVEHSDKLVVSRCRVVSRIDAWNEKTARLFAADCAYRALEREREKGREPDPRSWAAVEAARAFTRGEIGHKELAAAWDAAWDAARAAAWDAARDAAWDAAGAVGDAERQWQFGRLCAYLNGEDRDG